MPGLKFVLSEAFTDDSLPILRVDPILSLGSLLLFDANHSLGGLGEGVPANGAAVPNVAWETLADILGSGTPSSLSGSFTGLHQAADAVFERSELGGLHGIFSQTNNTNNNRGAYLRAPTALQTYVYENPSHAYYMSLWHRRTRAAISTPTEVRLASLGDSGTVKIVFGSVTTTLSNGVGSRIDPSANGLGAVYRSGASASGWIAPATEARIIAPMIWGNPLAGSASWNNRAASDVFYRAYVEDLTVSGRTFAQVDAVDHQLWSAAFAEGGRFHGDTYTDPATFP